MEIDDIREVLDFNPETGVFIWKKPHGSYGRIPAGSEAGWKTALGYRAIVLKGKQHYAHRLAWLLTHGEWPKNQIDHINGVRDDNRPINLRDVSHKENHQNVCQPRGGKLRGARWDKSRGKWSSSINVDSKHVHLGRFDTAEEAHQAYLKAKQQHHPFADLARVTEKRCG